MLKISRNQATKGKHTTHLRQMRKTSQITRDSTGHEMKQHGHKSLRANCRHSQRRTLNSRTTIVLELLSATQYLCTALGRPSAHTAHGTTTTDDVHLTARSTSHASEPLRGFSPLSHTHPHTLTDTQTHIFTHSCSHILTLSQSCIPTLSHSNSHTRFHTHPHVHSHIHPHTHSHTHTHTHTLTHSIIRTSSQTCALHTHIHTNTPTHSHTHTLTHTDTQTHAIFDFGQSDFGQKNSTDFGQPQLADFGQTCPEGGGGAPEGWGPVRSGAPNCGAPKGGARRVDRPKFRALSPVSRHRFFLIVSLWGVLVELWWCF